MAAAADRLRLEPSELRRRLDPSSLRFETTAEIEPLRGTIGQPRALDAIEFGLEMASAGYNLFVSGPPGSGRATTVRDYIDRIAASRPPPDDWVYLYNFDDDDRPRAIRLPPGDGARLARDLDELIEAAGREIRRAFESEQFERRRTQALGGTRERRDELVSTLQEFARERGFALELTPSGAVTAPLADGRPLSQEEFAQLPEEEREGLEQHGQEIQHEVEAGLRELRKLEKEAQERTRRLNREVALFAVTPLLDELRERYAGEPDVVAFLDRVQEDVPEHLPDFAAGASEHHGQEGPLGELAGARREEHLRRYRANVFVDNARRQGAPVVIERHPTYYNLLGRVQYRAQLGGMVTDFREIRPGALQLANGGFLVLDALDVLRQPFAWDALKRALLAREARIENLAEHFSFLPAATPRPQPIPLELKVVLIGHPLLYHLLYALDEDFRELFKVKVDFAPEMKWNGEHVDNYAAFISRCVQASGSRHLDRSAVARVVEYGARSREHQGKLSTRLLEISDVVTEASFWAGKAGRDVVTAEDVDHAVARKEYRSNLLEERIQELIEEGTLLIDTEGARCGQVNGLTVLDLGDYRFGRPARVTARVAVGAGQVESIEREIELSGPIHSKGFLTLAGFLSEQYGQERPLALRATIAFEQSYDEVEGDSASSTELYALLSALSGLPLEQGIAVTGSVNQHGQVQAVGGVTRKIEGFYATCKAKGLTGRQGVLIPRANVRQLMLADEVVQAVEEGRFHVWAVSTIDEGIELLTGRPAGERQADGSFPEGTVHRLIEERLHGYAERLREFAPLPDGAAELPRGRRLAGTPTKGGGR